MKALISVFVVAAAVMMMACAGNANKAAETATDSTEVTLVVDSTACQADSTAADSTVCEADSAVVAE